MTFIWLMMNYLCDATSKMAAKEIGKIMFFPIIQLLG